MRKGVNVVSILILIVLGLIVAFVFKKRLERLFRNIKAMRAKKQEQKLLEQLGIEPSFSSATFMSMAAELHEALFHNWYDWNCDETTIQNVLMRLQNDLDYTELSIAFGTRDTYDMETYIQRCLNSSERKYVNNYWEERGMTKRI